MKSLKRLLGQVGQAFVVDGVAVSQNEYDHAQRAKKLKTVFGDAEKLAEVLHQNYRAAAKAFKVPGPKAHDHGWCDCYGKMQRYFRRRARWLMSEVVHQNGNLVRTLEETDGAK